MNGTDIQWLREMVKDIKDDLAEIKGEVKSISSHGCAQRPNDMLRIENLEKFKEGTTTKFIGSLLTAIGALLIAIWNMLNR